MDRYGVKLFAGPELIWCGEVRCNARKVFDIAYKLYCDSVLPGGRTYSPGSVTARYKVVSRIVKVRKIPKKQKGVKRWSGTGLMSTR